MAKVYPKLDTRYLNGNKEHSLCLKLSHKSATRFIQLGYSLGKDQWNAKEFKIRGIENSGKHTARILKKLAKAREFLEKHKLEIQYMSIAELKQKLTVEVNKHNLTPRKILDKSSMITQSSGGLKSWSEVIISRTTKVDTANWYRFGVQAFINFNNNKEPQLMDIDASFLEEFKAWGYRQNWKPNTIGNAMRAVRSLMNKAIKEGKESILPTHVPFRQVVTPVETKEVQSIGKTEINALRELQLEVGSKLWKARAYFLFMFNAQGMNFADLAKLKISNKSENMFSYYRSKTTTEMSKTPKQIMVQFTIESLEIWNYFSEDKTKDEYVFDILLDDEMNLLKVPAQLRAHNSKTKSNNPLVTEKNRIRTKRKRLNESLGLLSQMIDASKKITTYDARYAWVNAALDADISEELIGKGLGHKNLAITRRYFEERHKNTSLGDINELITQ